MLTQEKLEEIYEISSRNSTLPQYVIGGRDYFSEIIRQDTLSDAVEICKDSGIEQDKIIQIFLTKDQYELSERENSHIIDMYGEDIFSNTHINDQLQTFLRKNEEYEDLVSRVEKILPLKYTTNDLISKNHYEVLNLEGEKVELSDITECFNKLIPTKQVQIIVMTNSTGKNIYKVATKYNISGIDEILKNSYEPNTITLLHEVVKKASKELKKAVINFENARCELEVNMGKINDTTFSFFNEVLNQVFILREIKDVNVVSGRFEINSIDSLPYHEFYSFIMTDKIASRMFIIDEKNNPWCSTRRFYKVIFFSPLCTLMDEFLSSTYSYLEFEISSSSKLKSCNVLFKTGDKTLKTIGLDYFSRIVRKFKENEKVVLELDYRNFFFLRPLAEIKERVGHLFMTEKQSGSQGYSTKCGTKNQPVFVTEEEAKDYAESGFDVNSFEGNGRVWHFTCLNEDNPKTKLEIAKDRIFSDNKYFACCGKEETRRHKGNRTVESTKIGTTPSIKTFGGYSVSPVSILSDFIKEAFLSKTNDTCDVKLRGTMYLTEQNEQLIEDSAIAALILAKGDKFLESKRMKIQDSTFNFEIEQIRKKLVKLPYEIFSQELYDTPRKDFKKNVLNRKHYIDPYLYYRGLEEIFDVNIICFTSRVDKRQFPSSQEESREENPTIEIPRCARYHTRRFDRNRDIVLLYKNFGSERKMSELPSCELICVGYRENNISTFKSELTKFFDKMIGRYYKCCEPFILRIDGAEAAMYSAIQDWNPNSLGFGEVIGQEIDIHGKAKLLIYENWNVEVTPGIQPLYIKQNSERVELKRVEEALKVFSKNVHEVVDDGILINFKGIKNGLKVLCRNDNFRAINYESVNEINELKNNVSGLLQFINWLWRSEYTEEEGLIEFEEWFIDKAKIYDEIEVQKPSVSINNLYLPKFKNYEERLNFCQEKWPCFFENGEIKLTESLALRIMNLMNFQDKYTRTLTPEEKYGEIPRFITGLLPMEDDYTKYETMVFTKQEQFKHWFNITTRAHTSHVSLLNMNVVSMKIYENLSYKINPYFYITENKKIYLIQNIHSHEESKSAALEVAKRWNANRENPGPYTVAGMGIQMNENYVIFKMDNENIPRQFKQISSRSGDYLCILNYNNGTFAAMLPID